MVAHQGPITISKNRGNRHGDDTAMPDAGVGRNSDPPACQSGTLYREYQGRHRYFALTRR